MATLNSRRAGAARKSRAEKTEETRDALFQATAETVGELGYADTSIARITQRAQVAQGTFYNYFESRQDIFDELLPTIGTRMLSYIGSHAKGATNFLEREERSLRAFFDFIRLQPYFLKIMNGAEIFAPKAHAAHFRNMVDGYTRFLSKARDSGEIPPISDAEIEATVYMLLSARGYLAMRYLEPDGTIEVPEAAISAYMRLVAGGLGGQRPELSSGPPGSTAG